MPATGDSLVASCAGDGEARVCNVEQKQTTVLLGHTSRVKKLATEPYNPHVLLSGAEDGTVRQWDLREARLTREDSSSSGTQEDEGPSVRLGHGSESPRQSQMSAEGVGDDSNVIFRAQLEGYSVEINSISLNQQRPWLLAVGADDQYLRLVDRRKSSKPVKYFCYPESPEDDGMNDAQASGTSMSVFDAFVQFGPNLGEPHSSHITGVAFSPSGDEVLASYHNGPVRLFDVDRAKSLDLPSSVDLLARSRFVDSLGITTMTPTSSSIDLIIFLAQKGVLARYDSEGKLANIFYKRGQRLFNEAVAARASDDPSSHELAAEARDDALRSLRLRGTSSRAWLLAARIHTFEGALEEAERSLQKAEEFGWSQELQDFREKFDREFRPQIAGSSQGPACEGPDMETCNAEAIPTAQDGSEQPVAHGNEEIEATCARQPESYTRSFTGHQNLRTVKDVSFLGPLGDCVASGSDDGHWFLWDKKTGRLLARLEGDQHVVNCVQSCPTLPLIASCGIDNTVKLWSPRDVD
eukprot:scaffold8141_cov430-Prasinococcus_capsulatus_cf.AAC.2